MTVRVERTFKLHAPPEKVWSFISDPAKRANAISVVESYEQRENTTTWHVKLPIPFVRQTIDVRTRDLEQEPPTFVKFVGESQAFRVTGEHRLEEIEGGTKVTNQFVVDGKVPGIEAFFERGLDDELDNLQQAMEEHSR